MTHSPHLGPTRRRRWLPVVIVGVLAAIAASGGTLAVEKATAAPATDGVRAVWPLDNGQTGAGAVAAVDFTGGGTLTATVQNMASGSLRLAFAMKVADGRRNYFPIQVTTSAGIVQIHYSPAVDFSVFYYAADKSITTGAGFAAHVDTGWHRWQVTVKQDGDRLDIGVSVDGTSVGSDTGSTTATLGAVTGITLGPPIFDRSTYSTTYELSDVGLSSP